MLVYRDTCYRHIRLMQRLVFDSDYALAHELAEGFWNDETRNMLLLDKAENAEIPLCAGQFLPQWKQPLSGHKLAVQAAFTFALPNRHLIIDDGRRSNHYIPQYPVRRCHR